RSPPANPREINERLVPGTNRGRRSRREYREYLSYNPRNFSQKFSGRILVRLILESQSQRRLGGRRIAGLVLSHCEVDPRSCQSWIPREGAHPQADRFLRAAALHIVSSQVSGYGHLRRIQAQDSLAKSGRVILVSSLIIK